MGLYLTRFIMKMEKLLNKKRQYELPFTKPSWSEMQKRLEILTSKNYKSFHQLSQILTQLYSINKNYQGYYEILLQALQKNKIQDLQNTFSKIAQFVLDQKEKYSKPDCEKFQLLLKKDNKKLIFTKHQVILLMCLSALGINSLNATEGVSRNKQTFHDEVNFMHIYHSEDYINKTPWILNYFNHVLNQQYLESEKNHLMSLERRSAKLLDSEDILKSQVVFNEPKMIENGSIQDYSQQNTVKVDFANKFIGGGSLSQGCVQEQIMFLNHPELYISMLFCQVMDADEAIGMRGFRKYFKNEGYASNTQYGGFDKSMIYKEQDNYLNDYIVAIDALCRSKKQPQEKDIMRQINKSYVGFGIFENVNTISTGNWGCGVFGGDPQLKFIIQWISASLLQKQMVYYTFGNKLMNRAQKIIERLKGNKIAKVYEYLLKFEDQCDKTVFQYLQNMNIVQEEVMDKQI